MNRKLLLIATIGALIVSTTLVFAGDQGGGGLPGACGPEPVPAPDCKPSGNCGPRDECNGSYPLGGNSYYACCRQAGLNKCIQTLARWKCCGTWKAYCYDDSVFGILCPTGGTTCQ
jgi:hypothetical protein